MRGSILVPLIAGVVALTGCTRDGGVRSEGAPAANAATLSGVPAPRTGDTSANGPAIVETPRLTEVSRTAGATASPDVATDAVAPAPAPASAAPRTSPGTAIPLAPMGRKVSASVLKGHPDYKPLDDPERDSVERGRRIVAVISTPLTGGAASAEELARQILDAVANDDSHGLHGLRVTLEEFESIFWPEFPQSRPATGIQAWDAWTLHDPECHDGVSETLSKWANEKLIFDAVEYTVGLAPYTNFNLYHGVVIHAHRENGDAVSIDTATIFAERLGRWKVYMFADQAPTPSSADPSKD